MCFGASESPLGFHKTCDLHLLCSIDIQFQRFYVAYPVCRVLQALRRKLSIRLSRVTLALTASLPSTPGNINPVVRTHTLRGSRLHHHPNQINRVGMRARPTTRNLKIKDGQACRAPRTERIDYLLQTTLDVTTMGSVEQTWGMVVPLDAVMMDIVATADPKKVGFRQQRG